MAFYFPRKQLPRESQQRDWRARPAISPPTSRPIVMASSIQPRNGVPSSQSDERVRVLPGMSDDTVQVTGYALSGRPVVRMEIPKRWLTPQWVTWLESRVKQEDATEAPQLKLMG